jgi:SNF2 family DNA or RNA helicase
LKSLAENQNVHGPFLIVTTLTGIQHWEQTFAEWTNFQMVLYFGIPVRFELIHQSEVFYPQSHLAKFDVWITTSEYVIASNFASDRCR